MPRNARPENDFAGREARRRWQYDFANDPEAALANVLIDMGVPIWMPQVRASIPALSRGLANAFLVDQATSGGSPDPGELMGDEFQQYARELLEGGGALSAIKSAYGQFQDPAFANVLRAAQARAEHGGEPGEPGIGEQPAPGIPAPRSSSDAELGSEKWNEPDELTDEEVAQLEEAGYILSPEGSYVPGQTAAPPPQDTSAQPGQPGSSPFYASGQGAQAPTAAPAQGAVTTNPYVQMLMELLYNPGAWAKFQQGLAAPNMPPDVASAQRDLTGMRQIYGLREMGFGPGDDFFDYFYGG